jgi:hypothetical protein
MPYWLSIAIAVACLLYALQQVRMYMIDTGRTYSPVIGPVQSATLSAIAMKSVLVYPCYALILLLVPWPRFVTYFAAVWVMAGAIDAVLGWFGKGVRGANGLLLRQTAKGQRRYILVEGFGVGIRGLIFAGFALWIG